MIEFSKIFIEVRFYLILFAVFTLLAFLTRGKSALKWSKDMKISAFINIATLKFNGYVGVIFFVIYLWVKDIYEGLNIPHIPREVWEVTPTPLTWIILLFVYDLSLYWIHRFMHNGWLWPIHAIHHSEENLHFLSWSRSHALENAIVVTFVFLCSTWLGLTIEEVFMLAYVKGIHQHYVHSNVDWDHGPLKKIIASPQYHRWHHANVKEAYDKNFASIFPFIDIMFGTYYHPHSAVDVPTGFPNSPKNDFIALICYPFTEWYRMIKERLFGRRPMPTETEVAE